MKNESRNKDFNDNDFEWNKYISFTKNKPSESQVEHALSKNIAALQHTSKRRVISLWTRMAAAAIIVIMLSVGVFFYFKSGSQKQLANNEAKKSQLKNDVAPGGNRAMLTLSNGSQVVLDSARKGTITQQGNTKIIKLDDGELVYNASGGNEEVLYNTVTTPKGGQYQIVLADGSKVWLNAASSIHFPTSFAGIERKVELTGEGYFEIAKDATKKFIVLANGTTTEVFGTHFNINAYIDEYRTKITLIEGSIKLNNSLFLKPGQQGQVNGTIKIVGNADIAQVLAWKNGWFEFDNTDLGTIIRQISRWYDLEIVYEGKSGNEKFGGRISKDLPLSNVLNSLESNGNGVKFTLKGNKLIVKP